MSRKRAMPPPIPAYSTRFDNSSSQNLRVVEDLQVLTELRQRSYSISHLSSLLRTKASFGQPSSLKDLHQLAQEVEDLRKVVQACRLLVAVRSIRSTGSSSLTRPTAESSELIRSSPTLRLTLTELWKETTILVDRINRGTGDALVVRDSLAEVITSVLGAEGRLTVRGSDYVNLPGTKEIQVLDRGFEVRYNLGNDEGEQERDPMNDDEFEAAMDDGGEKKGEGEEMNEKKEKDEDAVLGLSWGCIFGYVLFASGSSIHGHRMGQGMERLREQEKGTRRKGTVEICFDMP